MGVLLGKAANRRHVARAAYKGERGAIYDF